MSKKSGRRPPKSPKPRANTPMMFRLVEIGHQKGEVDEYALNPPIEGVASKMIDHVLVVSIPETTSTATAQEFREALEAKWPNREIFVTTHNVAFLGARPLNTRERERYVRELNMPTLEQ